MNKEVILVLILIWMLILQNYMILQSIDFLHLYQKEGVTIQIGGGDQWGNLTSGLELIRKTEGSETEVGVFTVPLLLDKNG